MSVVEVEDMTGRKIPKWESELWSYISQGDGEHCPLYSHCHIRQGGGWCFDDNRKNIAKLADCKRFDLSSYDFVKCGTCSGIFKLVEKMAKRYLKKGGVRCPPAPTELFSLADNEHPIEARLLPLKVYHGAIWRLKEGWVIQLKDDASSASRRFTLFHEAFHILAHCKATPVFRQRGTKEGSFNELLADYFATCILMPKEWVTEKWAEVKDLDRMAEIFDAPKSAMCVRLKRLGLI
ncbi:hypothetical protein ES703_123217 [subsurface metagenome]